MAVQCGRMRWILLAFGALAGCGGGTAAPNPPPPPPPSAPVVTTVTVTAPPAAVFMGDTVQLTAIVKDQRGGVMTGVAVSWASGSPAVATVDATGLLIALSSGSVTLTATAETKVGTAVLTVVGPGTGGGASGTALIGAQGGSVPATLPGGGTLALAIPAGALSEPVQVTLDPVVPAAGSLAAFRISPGGLPLTQPATLVIRVSPGAKVRPSTVLVFEQDGQRIPVPGILNLAEGTVTVSLSVLGLPASAAAAGAALRMESPGRPASTTPPANANLVNFTLDDHFNTALAALGQLQRLGTLASADAMQSSAEAVVQFDRTRALSDPRFGTLWSGWNLAVCAEAGFAFNVLQGFGTVSDYRNLERVFGQFFGWTRAQAGMITFLSSVGLPACPAVSSDPQAVILAKLQSLRTPIQTDLDGFALTPSPRDSVFFADRLKPLANLTASFELADFTQAAQLLKDLIIGQLDRVRQVGYTQCRFDRSQEIQGRMIRALTIGGSFAAFDATTLESDIELCGMQIVWRILDSTGAAVETGTVGGQNAAGSVFSSGSVSLNGLGNLELSGGFLLQALLCPSPASANAEQLEVAAGLNTLSLTRVSLLSPSNSNEYLAVSPLLIPITTLRNAAGIAADATATVKVVIRRIGGVCSGLFANLAHSAIGTLNLALGPPPPCPGPIAGNAANVCQPPPPPPPPPSGSETYIGTRLFSGIGTPFPVALIFSAARTRALYCIDPDLGLTPTADSRTCGALGPPFADNSNYVVFGVAFSGDSFQGQQIDGGRPPGPGSLRISGTISGGSVTGRVFSSCCFTTFQMP